MSSSSTSPRPTTPTTLKVDRSKAPTACDHCRQRKLRCDGNAESCSNCSLYRTTCVYAKGRNKSGPPKGSKRKKANPDDAPTSRQKRRTSESTSPPDQIPTPPASEGSMSSKVLTREISPASDTSSQYVPSLMGPLPITSDWLTDMSSAETTTSQFSPHYSGPLTYSFNDDPLIMDPLLLSTLFPDPIAPVADNLSPQYSSSPFSISPEASGGNHPQFAASFPNGANSFPNAGSIFAFPSPASFQQSFSMPSPASTSPPTTIQSPPIQSSSSCTRLLAAHAFVPLFPFSQLQAHIATSKTRKATSLHAALFLCALDALTAVTSISSVSISSESSAAYLAAQNQAMPAYFAALSSTSASDADDTVLTAAALLYLTARSIFSAPSAKEATTWLRLAREVVESPCFPSAHRQWFMRVGWLWRRGVVGAVGGALKLEKMVDMTQEHISEEMDEYQREFDGLVGLAIDLDVLLERAKGLATAAGAVGGDLERLAETMSVPLCTRVNEWMKTSALAREALLQFTGNGASASAAEAGDVREAVARVLHLIYYGFGIKFDRQDSTRCRMRRTSLYVAVTRIVDAADWLVSSHYIWLWSFAEPALLLARDFLLDRCGTSATPSPGELTLLSLIHDVLIEAASSLGPVTAQKAQQEAESITRLLRVCDRAPGRGREGVSKGDILGGIRELLAQSTTLQ
ncbi:hypothetical protein BKA93DRAFT_828448 [Sparassis latifolia]